MNIAVGLFPTGYSAIPVVRWQKRRPALEEKMALKELKEFSQEGVSFDGGVRGKSRLVISTPLGKISTLICSELLEARARADLLGRAELVVVPAWNKDTPTFDHAVKTAALDIHCFLAVANNGKYSDCRVWVPAADSWRREVARLISRGTNEVLRVDLGDGTDNEQSVSIWCLRRFHQVGDLDGICGERANAIRKLFKPLPPDFPER